jgi:hypothetical protein
MMAAITSARGLIVFSAPLTQGNGGGFTGTGNGTEYNAPARPGGTVPAPTQRKVSLTAGNTSGGTITGTFTFKE